MRPREAILSTAWLLAACSQGARTTTISDGPSSAGRSPDADLCATPRPAPAALRCVADANAQTIALGVCGDLVASNTLTIEARAQPATGCSLAVAGSTTNSAPLQVAGSLVSYGSIDGRNTQDIRGDLRTGADWQTTAPVTVGGDAFVTGALTARNSMSIAGALHVAQGTNVDDVRAGTVAFGSVRVAEPVDCAQAPDVAALIAQASKARDRSADAVMPAHSLEDLSAPTEVTLGCGTFELTSISANNTLSLHVVGATTLIVLGDVRIAAPTVIDLAPGATLDLAVAGALEVDNTLRIGDASRAAFAWVGVAGSITIAAPVTIAGWLVAPRSAVLVENTLDMSGGALVGTLEVSSPLNIHDGPSLTVGGCTASAVAP
jgi:hypothetical protein